MKHLLKAVVAGAAVALTAGAQGWSEQVTFTKDVLPILQENCQTCHRPSGTGISGMIAPMSLMTYQEVRPWAKSIAKIVQEKRMPPWNASEAQHGVFRNERSLTDEEINTLVSWVQQRAPRGNPQDAPTPIEFPNTGWNLGTPDAVVGFPEPYFVGDDIEDLYHNISVQVTDEQVPETRYIKSIEFKPGSEVVHHIIGYASMTKPGETETEENADFENRTMLGGIAPGTEHAEYPSGFGIELQPKSWVTFAMHYHKETGAGTGQYDSSEMGMKFADEKVTHPIQISFVQHGAMEIPPGAKDWRVGASKTLDKDVYLLSLMPHMHLRGKSATYTAYYPDGTSEVLLDVPAYDFNWQTQYEFKQMKKLPAGTRLEMDLRYNNTAEHGVEYGFNGNRAVRFGGPTTDEMDLAWFTCAPVQPVNMSANVDATQASGD